MSWRAHVQFVLVGTESPGNLGSAARALKTMGFTRLTLVEPLCDPQHEEARRLAHNAEEILAECQRFPTLDAALSGTHFSIGTSQRPRWHAPPYYLAEEAAPLALERAAAHEVALVFGRESSGLNNEELSRCSILSSVPAITRVPSLNLAQAVMVYAYELHRASLRAESAGANVGFAWQLANHAELEQFYHHLNATMTRLGARPAHTMDEYLEKFRRVFGRVPLESRDLMLLHSLLKVADKFVSRTRGETVDDTDVTDVA